jgi:hypothetical protein
MSMFWIKCLRLAPKRPRAAQLRRPDSVAASAWIPLTADAGFVVTGTNSEMVKLGVAPSVTGYLTARRGGKWVRLDPEGGGRLMPTK